MIEIFKMPKRKPMYKSASKANIVHRCCTQVLGSRHAVNGGQAPDTTGPCK